MAWGEADITAIKRLSDMGFKVTVTGGLALEDLPLFKGIPIHVFIAGRSIRDAASPVEAARQFKRSIAELSKDIRRELAIILGTCLPHIFKGNRHELTQRPCG